MTEISTEATQDPVGESAEEAAITGTDSSPTHDYAGPSTQAISNQRKLILLAAIAIPLLLIGVLYFAWAQTRVSNDLADRQVAANEIVAEFEATQGTSSSTSADGASVPATADDNADPATPTVEVVRAGLAPQPGEVLVVHRVPGDDYGRLAIRHADGTRTLLDRSCLRVHIAADTGVCLSEDDALFSTYTTTFFEADNPNEVIKSYASALPSRARMTPDGTLSSVTAFVTGSSYEDISTDSTTIVTIDDIRGETPLRGANQFTVIGDDARFENRDAQYWGMTFADSDQFYVTGFFGVAPEIMRGSVNDMAVEPTGWVGSCPSLSPDGKTLVFKESRPDGGFDLVAVDLDTQDKWKINETRSVDDQVEWLDNDTILYAVHPDDGENPIQPEFDIWMIDIVEGSEPQLFLPNADSPAVVR